MFKAFSSSSTHSQSDPRAEQSMTWYGTLGIVIVSLMAMLAFALSGCSSSSAHAVDPSRAREALKTALDNWKQGNMPGSLSNSPTPMTIQDFEWERGTKLIEYQMLDDGQPVDANLRVRVKLTTSGPLASKNSEKTVTYLVGTSPSVTVFRDMLRR